MVRQLKRIGPYSEKQARKYLTRGLLLLVPFAFLGITSIPFLPFYIDVGAFEIDRGFLMGVFATFGSLFIMLPYRTYRSGLTGEQTVVKNIADKLSNAYSLFNGVLLKDGKRTGNVDHIIVGPTGIFVIETKNNKGTVTYDGNRWAGISGSPSRQAISNTFRVKDILKSCEVFKEKVPYVNAVVVFTNSKVSLQLSKNPEWCKVLQIRGLTDSRLADYIRSEPIRFSDEAVASVERVLKARIGSYDE